MLDREKVIKGLEVFNKNRICLPHLIPWDEITDAIALLKEQGTRKGHWIEDETETYTENHDTWECSECHEPFTLTEGTPEENKFYFCPRCGADMR